MLNLLQMLKVLEYSLAVFALCSLCNAALSQHESFYQAFAAKELGEETAVTAKDGTRSDIVMDTHAIEVDFKGKWAEALDQSLNYAFQLNNKAGIVLIIENETDTKEALRLNRLIVNYKLPIKLWVMDADEMKLQQFSNNSI